MASSARIFGKGCRILMAAAKSSAASSSGATAAPKGRGRPNGILKPIKVSPALEKFLGAPEASRTDAVKKVWEYIKAHNLQVPHISPCPCVCVCVYTVLRSSFIFSGIG